MLTLICTQNFDPHAEGVIKSIKKLNGQAISFKRYNDRHDLTYKFKMGVSDAWLTINGKKYSLSRDIYSLFWRMKPVLISEFPGTESTVEEKFRMHEWRHAIFAMEMFLENRCVINHLEARTRLNTKVIQLKLANDCGLRTPLTIVSNNYLDTLENIPDEYIIYKTLSSFMTNDELIYTNKFHRKEIKKNKNSISQAPNIFQSVIEKNHELRVTVVGEDIFIAKIDSQKQSSTILDWRHDQGEHMFSEGTLSCETREKLLDFHRKAGLTFATYDFIIDKENNEIFLECNPSGQWLFVGKKMGEPINEAIARKLLGK
jgi:glutathione synthase/RimK-type ligase-like ATP-grasp enzyme